MGSEQLPTNDLKRQNLLAQLLAKWAKWFIDSFQGKERRGQRLMPLGL